MTMTNESTGWLSREAALSLETKGAIVTRTVDAFITLPVGANGTFLHADSSTDTGLAWSSQFAFPTTIPTTPVVGSTYYNVETNAVHIYNGTTWVEIYALM